MIIDILLYAAAIAIMLVVVSLPAIIGFLLIEVWDFFKTGILVMIVGYILMFTTYFVIGDNDLSGTGEVIGMEFVPTHTESGVRTQTVIIDGNPSIMTLPTNKTKVEAYVIHVRKKKDSKYKRYMLEVTEEEYKKTQLGDEIELSEYEKYD